jgi:hypothetical protein
VTELIELLLQGLIDSEEGHRPEAFCPRTPARAAVPSPPRAPARVLDLAGFRRRRAAARASAACGSPERPSNGVRVQASTLRRRASQVRARGDAAREAAARARAQADLVLEQLHSVVTPAW